MKDTIINYADIDPTHNVRCVGRVLRFLPVRSCIDGDTEHEKVKDSEDESLEETTLHKIETATYKQQQKLCIIEQLLTSMFLQIRKKSY